jgi:hypothetical protein
MENDFEIEIERIFIIYLVKKSKNLFTNKLNYFI